jgi:hypothetical protein
MVHSPCDQSYFLSKAPNNQTFHGIDINEMLLMGSQCFENEKQYSTFIYCLCGGQISGSTVDKFLFFVFKPMVTQPHPIKKAMTF